MTYKFDMNLQEKQNEIYWKQDSWTLKKGNNLMDLVDLRNKFTLIEKFYSSNYFYNHITWKEVL